MARRPRTTGSMDLRSESILRAVIEEYVSTAIPVGSQALVARYGVQATPERADAWLRPGVGRMLPPRSTTPGEPTMAARSIASLTLSFGLVSTASTYTPGVSALKRMSPDWSSVPAASRVPAAPFGPIT